MISFILYLIKNYQSHPMNIQFWERNCPYLLKNFEVSFHREAILVIFIHRWILIRVVIYYDKVPFFLWCEHWGLSVIILRIVKEDVKWPRRLCPVSLQLSRQSYVQDWLTCAQKYNLWGYIGAARVCLFEDSWTGKKGRIFSNLGSVCFEHPSRSPFWYVWTLWSEQLDYWQCELFLLTVALQRGVPFHWLI